MYKREFCLKNWFHRCRLKESCMFLWRYDMLYITYVCCVQWRWWNRQLRATPHSTVRTYSVWLSSRNTYVSYVVCPVTMHLSGLNPSTCSQAMRVRRSILRFNFVLLKRRTLQTYVLRVNTVHVVCCRLDCSARNTRVVGARSSTHSLVLRL